MNSNKDVTNLVGGGVLLGIRGSDLKAYRKKMEKDTLKGKRGIDKPIYWVNMRLKRMKFSIGLAYDVVKYFIVPLFKKKLT